MKVLPYWGLLIVAGLIYGLIIVMRYYIPKEPYWLNFLLVIPVAFLGGFFGAAFKDAYQKVISIYTKQKKK